MDTVATLLGIIVAVLTVIGTVTGFFKRTWQALVAHVRDQSPYLPIPKKSIIILPDDEQPWWHMGSLRGQPAMQVHGRFRATNITKYEVLLVAAKLRKPALLGMVLTKDVDSQYHGNYSIPPGHTTDLSVDFSAVPAVREEGEDFVADVAILDQFGNKHWIRKVLFRYN